jgi:hypothetical protein
MLTVNNRSDFIPERRHLANRQARQRRRVSNVISQSDLRRQWNDV